MKEEVYLDLVKRLDGVNSRIYNIYESSELSNDSKDILVDLLIDIVDILKDVVNGRR